MLVILPWISNSGWIPRLRVSDLHAISKSYDIIHQVNTSHPIFDSNDLVCHCAFLVTVSEDILSDQIRPALQTTLINANVHAWVEVSHVLFRIFFFLNGQDFTFEFGRIQDFLRRANP